MLKFFTNHQSRARIGNSMPGGRWVIFEGLGIEYDARDSKRNFGNLVVVVLEWGMHFGEVWEFCLFFGASK